MAKQQPLAASTDEIKILAITKNHDKYFGYS